MRRELERELGVARGVDGESRAKLKLGERGGVWVCSYPWPGVAVELPIVPLPGSILRWRGEGYWA